jgi:hypothetical protein
MKNIQFTLFLVLLMPILAKAQIINIEEKRLRASVDSVHWYGDVEFGASVAQVQKQVIQFRAGAQVEYKNGRHLFLSLSDYNLLRAGGQAFDNSAFQHIRYNYKFTEKGSWEVYGQVQNNKLQQIDLRALVGTGFRWRAYKSESGKNRIYWGSSLLLERNNFKSGFSKDYVRLSNYVSLTFQTSAFKFVSTTYYQPDVLRFQSARLSMQNSLSFQLSKKIEFKISAKAAYDDTVPKGINFLTYSLENGLKMKL